MPVPYQSDDPRDDIARAVAAAPTPLGKAMSAIPNMGNMPTQMPAGMPQTPAGGVPGSGLAPAGGSIVATPPPRMGMQGAARPLAGAGGGGAAPLGGLGAQLPIPTGMAPPPMAPQPMPEGVDQYGLMPPSGGVRGMGRMRGY